MKPRISIRPAPTNVGPGVLLQPSDELRDRIAIDLHATRSLVLSAQREREAVDQRLELAIHPQMMGSPNAVLRLAHDGRVRCFRRSDAVGGRNRDRTCDPPACCGLL